MASIINCLKKKIHSDKFSEFEKERIRDNAAELSDAGYKGDQAAIKAIEDIMNELEEQQASVNQQVETKREQLFQAMPQATKDKLKTREQVKREIKKVAQQIREAVKKKDTKAAWHLRQQLKQMVGEFKSEAASVIGETLSEKEKVNRRRYQIRIFRDYFGLTDADLRKLAKRDVRLMSDYEFKQFKDDLYLKAAQLQENRQARLELMDYIEQNRLKMVDNYRKALKLPTINNMSTEELQQFLELLQPYQPDDVFLTQREIETVDRTDLTGIRTWREAREKLAAESGVSVEDLERSKVTEGDIYRWDTSLAEKNPFYSVMVSQMIKSTLSAEMRIHEIENEVYRLAKASEKSRNRTLKERAIPHDQQIVDYLEVPADQKQRVAENMTDEQLAFAHYIQEYFGQALKYLMDNQMLGRGRENYFVHIRKTFLENAAEEGLKTAVIKMFENYKQDEFVFDIHGDTDHILPLEKFFQFSLQRTGNLDPTANVTRAFLTYMRTFEKKKMYDAIIPKLDIYAQSLTPRRYTPRGLEIDRSIKNFLTDYINNKKGRRIKLSGVAKQGGWVDMGLNATRTFITMLDLGLNIPVGIASFFGEQTANYEMLGTKGWTLGTARMRTAKGKAMIEKYRAFVGRSWWEEFTAPGREVTSRASDVFFGLFHTSTVTANKQFLLGSLTDEEWASGEVSAERLAEMRIDMGRFRAVPGSASLVGSTSAGRIYTQYRTWAIPIVRTLSKDAATLAKDLKNRKPGALTTREAKEIYRFVALSAVVFITGSILLGDSDDEDDFLSQLYRKIYRESLTMLQALGPMTLLNTPRFVSFLNDIGKNLALLGTPYKTRKGDRGVEGLKKQFTPRSIKMILPKDKKKK